MTLRNLFLIPAAVAILAPLSSCLNEDDNPDYTDWKQLNDTYYQEAAGRLDSDGSKYFSVITPQWAPGYQSLVRWHTPRQPLARTPLDNSTVYVKYEVSDIEGNVLDSSYANKQYGDSIYRTKPLNNIPGFWFTLTAMAEGDSVTCVIPESSGYGYLGRGDVKPYSTLVYSIKLKKIVAWEVPD